jgi:hypothetical protein
MAKGIALSRVEHGMLGKDGKNVVVVFNEGDKVDLPDDAFAALEAVKVVAKPRAAAPAASEG